jgi:predicted outer membrane repeat protein
MSRLFWKMFAPRTSRTPPVHRRPTPSFRPSVLLLEDRSLPSVVINLNDSGPGSLRDAVGFAVPGETITFAVTGTITLTTGQIASGTPNLAIVGPGASDLTISGGNETHTTSSRIFDFGDSSSCAISGLTFINGLAGPPTSVIPDVVGGAILSTGALRVDNCVFDNNIATDPNVTARGGAIASYFTLILNNDTFTNNSADDDGGAVTGLLSPLEGVSASLTANNCYFANNVARNYGGALAAYANLTLSRDFFNGNGGPLDAAGHITRANNGGDVSAWDGGLIEFIGGNPITQTIDKTTFAGGLATFGGGLYYYNATALLLTNSTFYGNDAFFGGGIYKDATTEALTIKSTTITHNNAQFSGGGISNFGGTLNSTFVLNDSIVAGNTDGTPFYGLVPDDAMGNMLATTTVDGMVDTAHTSDHNIIGHGRGLIALDVTIVNGITTVTSVNLDGINGNHVGTEAIPIDAGLSDLRNNGGPTVGANGAFNLKTVALLANSLAIGAADPATVAGTTDENGTTRSATTPNIGAIEYVANTVDHVIFHTQPTNTAATQTINPIGGVVVWAVDQYGNLVNNDSTDTVTLSIGADPSSGTAMLSGTLTLTFVNGAATFGDLSIDTAGTGYTLHATASGLTPDIDSTAFNIT